MIDKFVSIIRKQTHLQSIVHFLMDTIGSIAFRFFWIFPINDDKIVFCNFNGKGYGDNPKYICEEVLKRNLYNDIVWLVFSDTVSITDFPKSIRLVSKYSLNACYELATASVWINNVRMDGYIRKRKKQIYIQTWHGVLALKKVEADIMDSIKWYVRSAKNDSKMANVFLSGANIQTSLFQSSFWYSGNILEVGSPRNDIVLHQAEHDFRKKISDFLFLDIEDILDKKIVLYAPTFRDTADISVYNLDYSSCMLALGDKFGGNWILLYRLHPNISEYANSLDIKDKTNVYDVSSYPDMQELLAVSDVLITDYSSCMFDFSLSLKPCFLYVPDLSDYINDDRGVYYQIDQLPYPSYKTNNDLGIGISNFDSKQYLRDLTSFFQLVQSFELGNASQKVVDWIISKKGI